MYKRILVILIFIASGVILSRISFAPGYYRKKVLPQTQELNHSMDVNNTHTIESSKSSNKKMDIHQNEGKQLPKDELSKEEISQEISGAVKKLSEFLQTYHLIQDLLQECQKDKLNEAIQTIVRMSEDRLMNDFQNELYNIRMNISLINETPIYVRIFPVSIFTNWIKDYLSIEKINTEHVKQQKNLEESVLLLRDKFISENNIKKILSE